LPIDFVRKRDWPSKKPLSGRTSGQTYKNAIDLLLENHSTANDKN
jgi:hypothetical protein